MYVYILCLHCYNASVDIEVYTMSVVLPCRMGRRDDIDADKFSRRLYVSDGMIPRYTGYIPRKYQFMFPFMSEPANVI